MSKSHSYALCPHCNTWIPYEEMVYWYDDDLNEHHRSCPYCLNGEKPPANYVKNSIPCPWCESEDTDPINPGDYSTWRCNSCGETFGY